MYEVNNQENDQFHHNNTLRLRDNEYRSFEQQNNQLILREIEKYVY